MSSNRIFLGLELPYAMGTLIYSVRGDSAYSGQGDVIAKHALRATDFTNNKGARNRPLSVEDKSKNRTKSKVRAKVEHPFLILKRIFGFNKVRYRGLDKTPTGCLLRAGW